MKYFKGLTDDGVWFQVKGDKIECEEKWCVGRFEAYRVADVMEMCKIVVMPLVIKDEFWYPEIYGKYVDKGNRTHDLTLCEGTNKGMVCGRSSPVYEPCLLKYQTSICKMQRTPINVNNRFIEIGPQHICIITNDNRTMSALNKSAPFAGCIKKIKILQWGNDTYLFEPDADKIFSSVYEVHNLTDTTPFIISLDPLKQVLEQSELLRQHIETLEHTLQNNLVSAIIDKGRLVHLSSQIQQDTAPHWWDIFSGMSSTATNTFHWLLSPMVIIILILISLTITNICVYRKINRKIRRIDRAYR